MNHLFVLREQRHLDALVTNLKNNWRAFAQMDKPLGCTVAPYRMNRSQEQNALMWVWLTQTADQAWVQGQRFSAETWNEHFKRELLPERNAKGLAMLNPFALSLSKGFDELSPNGVNVSLS